MRPLQYKNKYINLRVAELAPNATHELGISQSRIQRISIRKYRNNSINTNEAEKNRVVGLMRQNGYSRSDRVAMARAFYGKASVRDCKKAVTALIDLEIAVANPQQYCDSYLGLDCSGFVNCYFSRAYGHRERTINAFYRRGRANLRVDFHEFCNDDVLIWCNRAGTPNGTRGRHIAVIDRVRESEGNELRATVVESSGTVGLVDSLYTFVKTRVPGVFRVHRPLKPTTQNHVRVVPVL